MSDLKDDPLAQGWFGDLDPVAVLNAPPPNGAIFPSLEDYRIRVALMQHYGKSNLADTIIAMLMQIHGTSSLVDIALKIGGELWPACKQQAPLGAPPSEPASHAQILFGMETLTGRFRGIVEASEASDAQAQVKSKKSERAAAKEVAVAMYGDAERADMIRDIWRKYLRDDTPTRDRALKSLFELWPGFERTK